MKLIREWIFVSGNDWRILTTIMEVPVPRKKPKRSNKSQDLYCLVREPHWSYNSGPQLLSQHNSLEKDQSKFNLTIIFSRQKNLKKKMWKHKVSNLLHWNYKSGHQLLSPHNSLGKDQSKFNLTIFFPLKKKCENTRK